MEQKTCWVQRPNMNLAIAGSRASLLLLKPTWTQERRKERQRERSWLDRDTQSEWKKKKKKQEKKKKERERERETSRELGILGRGDAFLNCGGMKPAGIVSMIWDEHSQSSC